MTFFVMPLVFVFKSKIILSLKKSFLGRLFCLLEIDHEVLKANIIDSKCIERIHLALAISKKLTAYLFS